MVKLSSKDVMTIDYRVAKYKDLELGDRYKVGFDGSIIDSESGDRVKCIISFDGYPICRLSDIYGKKHPLLVHRLVASTWIGNVKGYDVHHGNEDKSNPHVFNLTVMTHASHKAIHTSGTANPTSKYNEEDVHEICKLLKKGLTHKKIAEKMQNKLGVDITVDSINKIANGKNWKYISQQYDLIPEKREAMGRFTSKQAEIAQMSVSGMSVPQIAETLGIVKGTKAYVSLVKCVPRYRKKLLEGKYNNNLP